MILKLLRPLFLSKLISFFLKKSWNKNWVDNKKMNGKISNNVLGAFNKVTQILK